MPRLLLLIPLLVAACSKPAPKVDAELATQRLCNHLSETRKRMVVNTIGGETVWSDGALLERATDFPASLKALIDHPTETRDMLGFLQDTDANKAAWHHAEIVRTDAGDYGCEVTDGKIKAPVNCIYTTYVQGRYPEVEARLKGSQEPILFMVGDKLKAMLMPVKE